MRFHNCLQLHHLVTCLLREAGFRFCPSGCFAEVCAERARQQVRPGVSCGRQQLPQHGHCPLTTLLGTVRARRTPSCFRSPPLSFAVLGTAGHWGQQGLREGRVALMEAWGPRLQEDGTWGSDDADGPLFPGLSSPPRAPGHLLPPIRSFLPVQESQTPGLSDQAHL